MLFLSTSQEAGQSRAQHKWACQDLREAARCLDQTTTGKEGLKPERRLVPREASG